MSVEGADRKEENPPVEPSGLAATLDRTFGLTAAGSSVPTELRAGLATFLTMAYIMFVNPAILEKAGMDHGAVFVATCLAAALSTAIMGLYANYPIALAPGMGLNAYFAFTMVPELGGNWQLALGVVFLSGALFLLISVTPIREWLINAIPLNLKLGIAAGIGLFLALIGLQNAGLVAADATTLVKLGDLTQVKALLAIAGFLIIAGLAARKVPGAIIFGVIAVTLAAVWLGLEPWHGLAAMPPSLAPTFLKMDRRRRLSARAPHHGAHAAPGHAARHRRHADRVARQAGFLDKDGRLPRLRQALLADSGGAMLGAALGTSTTTAYIESAAGVEEGGRTGLTALVVAALFLASLFLAPLAQTVPPYATAPALLFVACLMATSLGAIQWDEPTEYIPALTIALMIPLSYSIATGIGLGFIAYVALKLMSGRVRDINGASAAIAGAFLLKLIFA